jgi:glycosyltransferase involved in cell wall biosynthesis
MRVSGGEVQVFLLMEGLRTRGHRNVLLCPAGSRAEAEASRRGFETRPIRMRHHLSLGAIRAVGRLCRGLGADVVHTNTGRDAWLGGFGAWRAGLPSVTTRRMDRTIRRGLRTRLTYGTFADRVVAISPGVRACLEEAGVPASRIVLIPEAVDPARIRSSRDRAKTRAALGVAPGDVLVLGLGALVERKGFDVLVDAVARLPASARAHLAVRVAGEGPSKDDLEARARRAGVTDLVRFLGAREDVGDLLAAAEVYAQPSRAEGLGVATLEAMGAGLPVVASRVGGLAFSVLDGETGLGVPAGDVDALSEALERLIGDEGDRRRMGGAGRTRTAEQFHPDAMVAAYATLYREVLAARRAST